MPSHLKTGSRDVLPGEAVNYLPRNSGQVSQTFTHQSKKNDGHTMQQHRPTYEVEIFLRMNLSYELIKHVKINSCLCPFDGRRYQ